MDVSRHVPSLASLNLDLFNDILLRVLINYETTHIALLPAH